MTVLNNYTKRQHQPIQTNWTTYQAGSVHYGYLYSYGFEMPYGTTSVLDGGFRGWAFLSITPTELSTIMNTNTGTVSLPAGSLPHSKNWLYPTIDDTDINNIKFIFTHKSILANSWGANSLRTSTVTDQQTATYSEAANKLYTTIEPTSTKTHITHLCFFTGWTSSAEIGDITIQVGDSYRFAAYTVGMPGSGAEIILDNTAIVKGDYIFFDETPKNSIELTIRSELHSS